MALYYYKNISLSRINLKNIWGKERDVYYYIYRKIQPTPKQNVIYLHIRKIQLTSGQKEKEKRFSYIAKIQYLYIYRENIYYIPIYKKNTTNPPGGK